MCAPYISGSGWRKGARIDGRLFAVQFDKVDQHQSVRWLTIVFGLGNSFSSGSAIRALSLAFPSHNGAPSDLASARSSFSYFSWHNSKIHLREGDEVVEG